MNTKHSKKYQKHKCNPGTFTSPSQIAKQRLTLQEKTLHTAPWKILEHETRNHLFIRQHKLVTLFYIYLHPPWKTTSRNI